MNFYRRKDFYCIMIKDEKNEDLFDTIYDLIRKLNIKVLNALTQTLSEQDIDYISYSFAITQAALVKKWLQDGMKATPEEMTSYFMFDYFNYQKEFTKQLNSKDYLNNQ